MTRRQLLSVPAAGLLARAGRAQRAYPGLLYRDYHRSLPDYLRRLAATANRTRTGELDRLTSAEAIRRRQKWAWETFLRLAGMESETAQAPETRTSGSVDAGGIRIEKLVYDTRPEFHVPALLYIPAGQPPHPAVLFQCGHALEGKAYEPYQRCCLDLAKLGFLVLAFDPMGQGERIYYRDASGRSTRLPSADDEHTLPGRQMLLTGTTATAMQVWDALRSLDVLAAHPLADAKRIGAAGHSGGGTLTMMLAAVDDRVAAVVVSDGNTENFACEDFIPPGSMDDAEQNIVRSGPEAFDRWDLLYPFAPKPLLITVSDRDPFAVYSPNYLASGWREFERLRAVYERLGARDRLAWVDSPLPHDLDRDRRLATCRWLARWLQNGAKVEEEPRMQPLGEEALRISAKPLGGATPLSLTRARLGRRRTPKPLEELLRLERPKGGPFRVLARAEEIEAVEVESAPGVWLAAWFYSPRRQDASKPAILALNPAGRDGAVYAQLAEEGHPVCAAALRGAADASPEYGRGNPEYARSHNTEEAYGWAGLILGRPMAGQRTTDILALAAAVRAHPAATGRRLRVAARERFTVPALFGAALDARIDELYLAAPLVSFADVLEKEDYNAAFSNFVPSILLHTDLPEIARSIAPRRVTLAGAVDAGGDAVDAAPVYAGVANVRIEPEARWL
ncbi:MAG TPA: acetylxylan esterase [Bryobacteraceae bacterium]